MSDTEVHFDAHVKYRISYVLMIFEFSRIKKFLFKGWTNIVKFDESYNHINFYFILV